MFVILLFASLAAATERLKCFLIIATLQHMNENKVIVTDIFIKSVVMGARLLQQCWRFTLVYFSAYKSDGKCPSKRENLLAISRLCRDVETFFLLSFFSSLFSRAKSDKNFREKASYQLRTKIETLKIHFSEKCFFLCRWRFTERKFEFSLPNVESFMNAKDNQGISVEIIKTTTEEKPEKLKCELVKLFGPAKFKSY